MTNGAIIYFRKGYSPSKVQSHSEKCGAISVAAVSVSCNGVHWEAMDHTVDDE